MMPIDGSSWRVSRWRTVAAPIFRVFMQGALSGQTGLPFRVAPGVEIVNVDYHSGALSSGPGSIPEVFKPNTAPGEPDAPGAENGEVTDVVTDPATPAPTGTTPEPSTGGLY